jgi:hypothetical protein
MMLVAIVGWLFPPFFPGGIAIVTDRKKLKKRRA